MTAAIPYPSALSSALDAAAGPSALLQAPDLRALAAALRVQARALGVPLQAVAWLQQEALQLEPPESLALQAPARAALEGQPGAGVLRWASSASPSQEGVLALLAEPQACAGWSERLQPLREDVLWRLRELLRVQQLQAAVRQLGAAERLQRALFAIADRAASGDDMQHLVQSLHQIVGTLMYAENFFIALYDRLNESLRFIYFADVIDGRLYPPEQEIPAAQMEHSLTLALVRQGRAVRGTSSGVAQMLGLPATRQEVGTPSVDFIGVPLLQGGVAVGALVVQSYEAGRSYTEQDQAVLAFVAEHVLTAVERKLGQQALEQRVAERTKALAQANARLQQEVAERERAAHLQATLFRIAALGHAQGSDSDFYRDIHRAVGELINAENFYVALLSEDGSQLSFPYGVDSADDVEGDVFATRQLGPGMTEYAIRQGRTVLFEGAQIQELVAGGEIDVRVVGQPSLCWLGAPLLGAQGVMGLVAVQSYRADLHYGAQDVDLLTFVAYQIASTLQRRRQAEALQRMNAELEQRVQARTQELLAEVQARQQAQQQLEFQLKHDTLTGLPNRRFLRERIGAALARLQCDAQQRFALLYLDVDRFKLFNDSLGHQVGDVVLRAVAARLLDCVRQPDIAGRLAGDEFAVLLERCPDVASASRAAARILERMREPIDVGGRQLHTSISIGIALGHARHGTVDALLHDADVALYRAKSAGRQRWVLFDDSLQTGPTNVLDMEQQLRQALTRGEFVPYFQPIVRMSDGQVAGYEALIRWQHPTRGLLEPGEFLPVAEKTGLLEAIDWHMYRIACEQGRTLVAGGGYINVNISPHHFQNEQFEERLLALLAATGFPPAQLRIEVTEGILLSDPEATAQILQRLEAVGVCAALDDFGTGYSSLGYVHRFPLKTLKIDRSFIAPLGDPSQYRSVAIITAVLHLARSLGTEVVAEGVERAQQRDILLALGCAQGQGYFFGRPSPASHWLAPAP